MQQFASNRFVLMMSCFAALAATSSQGIAAIALTGGGTTNVPTSAFGRSPSSSNVTSVSSSQAGGSYTFTIGSVTGVATVASGSTASPNFSLTVSNNTGSTITGLLFGGTVAQLKDNSSNVIERLTATVSGLSGITASNFNIEAVSNNGDASSTVNNPPLTKPYSPPAITGLTFSNGSSFTITWTDANDGGTDAMFGLANLSINATLAATNVAPAFRANGDSSTAAPNYTFTVDFGRDVGTTPFSQLLTAGDSDIGDAVTMLAGTPTVSGGQAALVALSATPTAGTGGTADATLALTGSLGFQGNPYTITVPLSLTDGEIAAPLTGSVTINVIPEPTLVLTIPAMLIALRRAR